MSNLTPASSNTPNSGEERELPDMEVLDAATDRVPVDAAEEVDDDRAQTRDRAKKPTRRSQVARRDLIGPGGPTSEVDGVANDRARQCSAHRQGDEWDQRVDKGRAKDTSCALVTCRATPACP